MKVLNDEEIQLLLETGSNPAEGLMAEEEKQNLAQYRSLFENLQKEPTEGLSYRFASSVRIRLQQQLNRKKDVKFYLAAFVMLMLCFGAFYGLLLFLNVNAGDEFLEVLFKFKWVIVLGGALFLGILYLDQKLVKENTSSEK